MSRFPAFEPLPASSFSFGEVLYKKKEDVARITIARPDCPSTIAMRTS